MSEDDAFLNSIPAFLRRPEESAPDAPLFGIGTAATGEDPAIERDAATVADNFFTRSRAEIALRLDAAPDPEANDDSQRIEIALPATVAHALKARAERDGCDESVVVLAALRRMGMTDTGRRKDAPHTRIPRRHRRRRRA